MPAAGWIWRAWFTLNDTRSHVVAGFSAGGAGAGAFLMQSRPLGIPWTALAEWADRNGIGAEDLEMLEACIRAMDAVYFEWWAEKHRKA